MGAKSAANLLEALERSKRRPLPRFLFALGIRHVGEHVARLLAAAFGELERLAAADHEALEAVAGIGPEVAGAVRTFFDEAANRAVVDGLLAAGVIPEPVPVETAGAAPAADAAAADAPAADAPAADAAAADAPAADAPAAAQEAEGRTRDAVRGRTFVFTGTLEGMTRREAEEAVTALGGRATGSVSARTDYVVAGEAAGSKRARAETLGVRVLDEAAFRALLAAARG
jgi:DNA ligase (NAD+)